MIKYEKVLELENLTLDDCLALQSENFSVEINDGKITNLVKE